LKSGKKINLEKAVETQSNGVKSEKNFFEKSLLRITRYVKAVYLSRL